MVSCFVFINLKKNNVISTPDNVILLIIYMNYCQTIKRNNSLRPELQDFSSPVAA